MNITWKSYSLDNLKSEHPNDFLIAYIGVYRLGAVTDNFYDSLSNNKLNELCDLKDIYLTNNLDLVYTDTDVTEEEYEDCSPTILYVYDDGEYCSNNNYENYYSVNLCGKIKNYIEDLKQVLHYKSKIINSMRIVRNNEVKLHDMIHIDSSLIYNKISIENNQLLNGANLKEINNAPKLIDLIPRIKALFPSYYKVNVGLFHYDINFSIKIVDDYELILKWDCKNININQLIRYGKSYKINNDFINNPNPSNYSLRKAFHRYLDFNNTTYISYDDNAWDLLDKCEISYASMKNKDQTKMSYFIYYKFAIDKVNMARDPENVNNYILSKIDSMANILYK